MIWLFGKIKTAIAFVGSLALTILLSAVYFSRRATKQQKQNEIVNDLTGDRDTNRRMNDADIGYGDSADANREWLQNYAKRDKPKRRP